MITQGKGKITYSRFKQGTIYQGIDNDAQGKLKLRSQIMSIAKHLNQAIFKFFQTKWKFIFE